MAEILTVDDTEIMILKLQNILEDEGHDIVGKAQNGVQAVEKYQELDPDLVTMDITMPEMDGIEAVKKITDIDASATIIMVSAMGKKQKVLDAVKAGAEDFIVKPFEEEKVISSINDALDG